MPSVNEQAPLPFYENGLPELDRFQRIEVLSHHPDGFLPVSKPEQVEAMGLKSVISKSYGTSKHLAEVATNRRKNGFVDVERACRKIVRSYIDWALDAQITGKQLNNLAAEIHHVNPKLSLNEPDLAHDIGRVGLLKFMRYYDLTQLRDLGGAGRLPYDPQKIDYSESNSDLMTHLEVALASWRVGQVKSKIPFAQQDSSNRFLFWAPRLVEVTQHSTGSLKAIAREGLDKIYAR